MIRTQRWLTCAFCDAEFAGRASDDGGESATSMRARARDAGWRRGPIDTPRRLLEDACPTHANLIGPRTTGPMPRRRCPGCGNDVVVTVLGKILQHRIRPKGPWCRTDFFPPEHNATTA